MGLRYVLLLLMLIFALAGSPVFAKTVCQEYFDRYTTCIELEDDGRNMDFSNCFSNASEYDCEEAGCTWNPAGIPHGACSTDICLADTNFDGRVTGGADLRALKAEIGRMYCPTSIRIMWDENEEVDLAGYRVYRDEGKGNGYVFIGEVVINYFTIYNAFWNKDWAVAVTAFDTNLNESKMSNFLLIVRGG